MHGIDAQSQQLKRARSLARSADTAVDTLQTMLQIGNAARQRTQALARLGQTHLASASLPALGVIAAHTVELIVGLGNLET